MSTIEKKRTEELETTTEMGKLISEFDWSSTTLGHRSQWSPTLKSVVNLMLTNRFPMLLWWGKEYVQIYNDPYIPVLGMKHPTPGLGNPGSVCWNEIWDVIGPLVDTPFRGGPATWMDDILLKVQRNNFTEETHFVIAYSPVLDPGSPTGIGGVLATVNEITQQVITKRQMETLRKLGKAISTTLSENDVYAKLTSALADNSADVPFALVYKVNDEGSAAKLIVSSNIDIRHPDLEQEIDMQRIASGSALTAVDNYITHDHEMGIWDVPPTQLAYLPIKVTGKDHPAAVLVVALNPYRKLDESYTNFLQLVVDQVRLGLNNALAFETEKKRAEALSEIDRAKTIFFGNVSHEFRTPLTLMLGPINDLLVGTNGNKAPVSREVLELIQRNGLRLEKLVNTILDFSRIEAGRYQAEFKPVNISKLTGDLASNFRSAMAKADLKFNVECENLNEPVYVDHDMWEKIVLNLISNAFKYTLKGSVTVSLCAVNNSVELKVSDTGVGIPKQELPRLFERFHRIPNTRSRSFEGSGIGLALVYELVKMHGGTISVESEPDKGTTFTVTIPKGKEHLNGNQVKHAEPATFNRSSNLKNEISRWLPDDGVHLSKSPGKDVQNKPRVILADDNADMRSYITSMLHTFCDVHAFANGKLALEAAQTIEPDLVISDVMMPEMDGFTLINHLRSDPVLRPIPVILLSARAGEEAKVEGLQSGADDYLTKPFNSNELVARVKANINLSKVRKEVHEAVRYSDAQLRALVTATSDVIYRMSPDWKEMRQLDGRNFLEDTGEPISNWAEKYIHPKDRDRVWEVIQQSIRTKSIFQLEHQVIRADGTLGWTSSRAIPIINLKGEITEWFGAASDITARKLYETELEDQVESRTRELNEANTQLKTSNDDLQQFAHVASHDLKEPVRKIKTYTFRLRDEDHNLSEQGKVFIDKILNSAERMSTMIDGVLAYSSLSGTAVQTERVDLNETMQDIMSDLELVIQQTKGTIRFKNLPVVIGGKILIYQLFYNLVSNSLKFSNPDRQPVVDIACDIIKDSTNPYFQITVSDNGIGFDPKQNEKIFESFSRLNPKDMYDGTGLGLALCRKIVERHNGRIEASGEKGVGAKFTVKLPIDQQPMV